MQSYFNISCLTMAKIFNTISHIIYSELTQEDKALLRRSTGVMNQDILDQYRQTLGIPVLTMDNVVGEFYKLFVKEDGYIFDKDANLIPRGGGDLLCISFLNNIDTVKCIPATRIFTDDYGTLHLLIPAALILESPSSVKEEICEDLFRTILTYFCNYEVYPAKQPENGKVTIVTKKRKIDLVVTKLTNVLGNLLIDDKRVEKEIERIVYHIIDEFGDKTVEYVKINLSKIQDFQIYLFSEVLDV